MAIPPPAQLIGDLLRYHSQQTPLNPAMIWNDTTIDYATFSDQVARCREVLLNAGVSRGDRVAVMAPPRPEVMVLFVAVTDIGAIFLGINARATQAEQEITLANAEPKILFSVTRHGDNDLRHDLAAIRHRLGAILTFDAAIPGISEEFTAALALADPTSSPSTASPEDPAVLVYTSGSTGTPKGALVSHRSLLAGMKSQAAPFRNVEPARLMFHVPINHLGSVGNCGTTALLLGGAMVFLEAFSPRAALELIERERISIWAQVPTMFLMQMAVPEWDTTDFSSVKSIFFAGSVMPAEGVARLSKLCVPMYTGYGLTETSGPVTVSLPTASIESLSATIGTPCHGVELRIGDDNGAPLSEGMEGEILVRGDCIFPGYFRNEDATRAAIDEDGWFHTGDLGFVEGELIKISGRKQDAFKSGGVNIYPREIEEVLQNHPSIALACVVSIPDPIYQEVGIAFLVPCEGHHIDKHDIERYCAQWLTKYKIPRRFEIRAELPVIGIGKPDKVRLKAEAINS